jgi:hypothetical protein
LVNTQISSIFILGYLHLNSFFESLITQIAFYMLYRDMIEIYMHRGTKIGYCSAYSKYFISLLRHLSLKRERVLVNNLKNIAISQKKTLPLCQVIFW